MQNSSQINAPSKKCFNQIINNYPQPFYKIPILILLLKAFSMLASVSIPLVLQNIYQTISANNLWAPLLSFIALVALSFLSEIFTELVIFNFKINQKIKLSQQIIRILTKTAQQYPLLNILTAQLPIYIDGYYISYLCLVYESIKLIFIIGYLFYKLGTLLFLGLIICGLVVYSTLILTKKMQYYTFQNLQVRQKKIDLFKKYLSRVTQFKMSWLDNVIRKKGQQLQNQYLYNLEKEKMLDCWCVGLWQFTSIGASAIVLSAFYIWGNTENTAFYPATIIYYFNMMSFPLNGISWFIAGLRNATKAIQKIKQTLKKSIQISQSNKFNSFQWYEDDKSLISTRKFKLQDKIKGFQLIIQPFQLKKGCIYAVTGQNASIFLQQLSQKSQNYPICFAEQNSWHQSMPEQSVNLTPKYQSKICFKDINKQIYLNNKNTFSLQEENYKKLFLSTGCDDVPFHNPTQTYSGGQKMRLSLARAFNFKGLIVIDSELTSLDKKLRNKIKNQIISKAIENNCIILIKGSRQSIHSHALITVNKEFFKIRYRNTKVMYYENSESQKEQQKQNLNNENSLRSSKRKKKRSPELMQQSKQSCSIYKRNIQKEEQYQKVGLQTYKLYFSSHYHIWFLLSIIGLSVLKHGYNYYMNTSTNSTLKNEQAIQKAINMMFCLVGYCIAIFLRSYLFAKANIEEAKRISKKINDSIIMNQIKFYRNQGNVDKQKQNKQNSTTETSSASIKNNQKNKKTSYTVSQLVQLSTIDSQTLASGFPFHTNILFNNIFEVTASFLIMIYQVPILIIFAVVLIIGAKKLDSQYRQQNERMQHIIKKQQAKIIKTLGNLQKGKKILISFKRTELYILDYLQNIKAQAQLDLKSTLLGVNMNLKFRMSVVLFMGFAIYGFIKFSNNQIQNIELSVLVNYSMLLANYLLYLTFSLNDSHMKAVSIQRVRNLITKNSKVQERQRLVLMKEKQLKNICQSKFSSNQYQKNLISIKGFDFSYDENIQIFKNLNFYIQRGDKIKLYGRSGGGKTTLFKILTELYPEINTQSEQLNISKSIFVSLSPQHPLLIPLQNDLMKNIDPFGYLQFLPAEVQYNLVNKIREDFDINELDHKSVQNLAYQKQLLINNYRGYLYGLNGIVIYDQPMKVIENCKQKKSETFIVISHHKDFNQTKKFQLQNGKLIQKLTI